MNCPSLGFPTRMKLATTLCLCAQQWSGCYTRLHLWEGRRGLHLSPEMYLGGDQVRRGCWARCQMVVPRTAGDCSDSVSGMKGRSPLQAGGVGAPVGPVQPVKCGGDP